MSIVKRYIFDLDGSAKDRWEPILEDFQSELPKLKVFIDTLMNQLGVNGMVYTGLNTLVNYYKNNTMFYDELIYISEFTKIDFSKLLLISDHMKLVLHVHVLLLKSMINTLCLELWIGICHY